MKSKNWLSINYFLQYAVQGVFFQYWLVYLTEVKNLSIFEASSVFSMVYLARFIGGVFISSYLIKFFGMKNSYRIISIGGFFATFIYLFTYSKLSLMLVTFFIGITFFTLTPLTETTASIFLKEEGIDYGRVRVFGSFSFMLIGSSIGTVLHYINNEFIYYSMLFLVGIYCVFICYKTPKLVDKIQVYSDKNKESKKSFYWMRYDYSAILLIVVYFLLQLSHSAYNNYSVLYIESLNISKKWLTGLIVNISVISEIIFFIFSKKFIRQIEAKNLLLFSCFIASVRWLLLGIFQNVYIFAITQVTHAITFALAQLAFILILNNKFSVDKTLDMQTLYSSIGFQLSAFIGMYVVGSIWEISTQLVFYVSSLIALISLIIAFKIKFK